MLKSMSKVSLVILSAIISCQTLAAEPALDFAFEGQIASGQSLMIAQKDENNTQIGPTHMIPEDGDYFKIRCDHSKQKYTSGFCDYDGNTKKNFNNPKHYSLLAFHGYGLDNCLVKMWSYIDDERGFQDLRSTATFEDCPSYINLDGQYSPMAIIISSKP